MFLKKAEGSYFRNFREFSLEFTSPLNVFTGDNGQGKSSFLEALYCCLRGKSFNSFVKSQFVQNDRKQAKVCLTLEEEEGISTLESSFYFLGERFNKEIFYCGKKVGNPFLLKKFPCFVFTEESMKCIRQGHDQRRNFIDEMLGFDCHKQVREKFSRILKEKRTFLKEFKQGFLSFEEADKLLTTLNHTFLKCSFELVQERLKVLGKLFSHLEILKNDFFKAPLPKLSFSYCLSGKQNLSEDKDIFLLLQEDLKRKRDIELSTGTVLSGPQRHEIFFLFNGEDSRAFCSKGEQRTFILSLLGSHINQISGAFLFLDDVLMELDEETQNKFLKFLEKNHCQTFLTNCNLISFKTEKMSFFSVKNARINKYD